MTKLHRGGIQIDIPETEVDFYIRAGYVRDEEPPAPVEEIQPEEVEVVPEKTVAHHVTKTTVNKKGR